MPKYAFIVPYFTDHDKEVKIKINYYEASEAAAQARLTKGGWSATEYVNVPCDYLVRRRQLKPRYIMVKESGKSIMIYVKSPSKWIDAIGSSEIIGYSGEEASACGSLYLKNL